MAIRPQEPSCCSGETKLPSLGQWWALPWAPLCICDLGPLGLEDGLACSPVGGLISH